MNKLIPLSLFAIFVCFVPMSMAWANLEAGNHIFKTEINGKERTYILHVPPLSSEVKTLPLVINFHGGKDNAQQFQEAVQMDKVADQMGYAVVYPNGSGRWNKKKLTWNAGQCCGSAVSKKIDDVAFVRQLVRDVAQYIPLDRERVYTTGFDNGGMMAYRLAIEAADLIAAVAPVAGSIALEQFAPTRFVPVMHVHSIDDSQAPYKGRTTGFLFNKVVHTSVAENIEQWAKFNQCTSKYDVARSIIGGLGTSYAGQKANLIVYSGCEQGAEVSLWQLQGIDHEWPGAPLATQLINANKEILQFFSRFRRQSNGQISLQ